MIICNVAMYICLNPGAHLGARRRGGGGGGGGGGGDRGGGWGRWKVRKSKMVESELELKSKGSLQLETIQNLIKLLDW